LIFCIIKLRSTTTTWGLIGYFAGVCLSGWIAFRLIKYFAENYVWVSITIAIIMALVGFSFIIFMGVALVKAIYQALKNRNKTVNE
jgi:ABC-type antimicrobial peptide transport system permease subunit